MGNMPECTESFFGKDGVRGRVIRGVLVNPAESVSGITGNDVEAVRPLQDSENSSNGGTREKKKKQVVWVAVVE